MITAIVLICFIVTICFSFCIGYIVRDKGIGCKEEVLIPKTDEKPTPEKTKLEQEADVAKARAAEKSMHNFRNLINYNGKAQAPYDEVR